MAGRRLSAKEIAGEALDDGVIDDEELEQFTKEQLRDMIEDLNREVGDLEVEREGLLEELKEVQGGSKKRGKDDRDNLEREVREESDCCEDGQ